MDCNDLFPPAKAGGNSAKAGGNSAKAGGNSNRQLMRKGYNPMKFREYPYRFLGNILARFRE